MYSEMNQLAFYFDQNRCHGCQTCVVACKEWNGVNPGPASWREIHDVEVGDYPTPENNWANLEVFMAVYSCMHCENPACVDACAFKAIYKRQTDGIVVIDREKCRGLGECVKACPYKAPRFADDNQEAPTLPLNTATKGHTAQKCGFCMDRIYNTDPSKGYYLKPTFDADTVPSKQQTGLYLKPACVGACLTRALDFGTLKELKNKYPYAVRIADGDVPGFPADNKGSDGRALAKRTNPSILVKLRKK